MTDCPKRGSDVVHVRLIGHPDAVDQAAASISTTMDSSIPSSPQSSRKNPERLVRFEVIA